VIFISNNINILESLSEKYGNSAEYIKSIEELGLRLKEIIDAEQIVVLINVSDEIKDKYNSFYIKNKIFDTIYIDCTFTQCGDDYIGAELAGLLTFRVPINNKENVQHDPFSNRERELINLISTGLSSKQIAEVMGISTNTVRNHKTNIKRKLGINGNSKLISESCRLSLNINKPQ